MPCLRTGGLLYKILNFVVLSAEKFVFNNSSLWTKAYNYYFSHIYASSFALQTHVKEMKMRPILTCWCYVNLCRSPRSRRPPTTLYKWHHQDLHSIQVRYVIIRSRHTHPQFISPSHFLYHVRIRFKNTFFPQKTYSILWNQLSAIFRHMRWPLSLFRHAIIKIVVYVTWNGTNTIFAWCRIGT